MRSVAIPLVALALGNGLGCAQSTPEPQVASSAGQTVYAQDYPNQLQSLANAQANGEGDVKAITADFAKYPDQLKDPPWAQVLVVINQADASGRSAAYVDRERDVEKTQTFFTEEKEEITKRVAGSVQYAAKKKECADFEAYGPVSASLKESVDKQLEKRLRAANEAHLTIDRYRDSFGKGNAGALEKQADAISTASYSTYLKLPAAKAATARLLAEADQVRKTLDRSIQEEQTLQAEPGRSAGEKKASADRLTRLNDAKGRIDAAVLQAQGLAKEQDQRNAAVKKEYDDALDALRKAVSAKANGK